MYRDLFKTTADIIVDFSEYFDQLKEIGETEYKFNRTLYQENIDNDNILLNCWNLSYINLTECTLQSQDNSYKIEELLNYQIKRFEKDGPKGEPLYYFDKIAFTIRNVPILPYVTLSDNI